MSRKGLRTLFICGIVAAPFMVRVEPVVAPFMVRIEPVVAPFMVRIEPVVAPFMVRIEPVVAPFMVRIEPAIILTSYLFLFNPFIVKKVFSAAPPLSSRVMI